ncbi:MAG: cbb3-type cytochrome c oxidase subunit II, partial [Desulfobulbaceae bacterium]|nr:cbb3-type cytochrome c oxidase subunit II [Desulfobulbaceae bacterium]
EGCNNCHTQTIRPLVAEVLRYGDYSKSGEFVYDQPHLWGSRRTGPDLARIGGKYPDAWHVQHMKQPTVMIPQSNMPSYTFLEAVQLDPAYTEKKMKVLDFPYTPEEITALTGKTELDALVAYLQKLGNDIPWRQQTKTAIVGQLNNPYKHDEATINEGNILFEHNCEVCHDIIMKPNAESNDIGPPLTNMGDFDENEMFTLIHDGIEGSMPGFAKLGANKIWKIIIYLKYHHTEHETMEHRKDAIQ